MTTPVAHGLFARIVALTPASFDFVKAAQERPSLAEAAAELGQRIRLYPTPSDAIHHMLSLSRPRR